MRCGFICGLSQEVTRITVMARATTCTSAYPGVEGLLPPPPQPLSSAEGGRLPCRGLFGRVPTDCNWNPSTDDRSSASPNSADMTLPGLGPFPVSSARPPRTAPSPLPHFPSATAWDMGPHSGKITGPQLPWPSGDLLSLLFQWGFCGDKERSCTAPPSIDPPASMRLRRPPR